MSDWYFFVNCNYSLAMDTELLGKNLQKHAMDSGQLEYICIIRNTRTQNLLKTKIVVTANALEKAFNTSSRR